MEQKLVVQRDCSKVASLVHLLVDQLVHLLVAQLVPPLVVLLEWTKVEKKAVQMVVLLESTSAVQMVGRLVEMWAGW